MPTRPKTGTKTGRKTRRGTRRGTASRHPDLARLNDVLGEAWRNTITGTSRALLGALVLALTVGALGAVQARMVVGAITQATAWRQAAASVFVTESPGAIDGASCQALSGTSGVVAAGALRKGPEVRAAVMVSQILNTFEATMGIGDIVRLDYGQATPGQGVWVSQTMAGRLGIQSGGQLIALTNGQTLRSGGVFGWPDDGRDQDLSFAMVAPVPPSGVFDSCWIEVWPDHEIFQTLGRLPVVPQPGADAADPAITSQVNSTLGAAIDAPALYQRLALWPLTGVAALIAGLIGYTLCRARRLEIAADLHAGMSKPSISVQTLTEAAWMCLPALAVALPAAYWAATWQNPSTPWAAFYPAARTLILAALATLAGTQTAVLTTREHHLFRYFKAR